MNLFLPLLPIALLALVAFVAGGFSLWRARSLAAPSRKSRIEKPKNVTREEPLHIS
jgi:hypothetical protein